ncbi:WXG100 family type VII secretion target [Bacillus cytotoxicus]|uniref:WXG100 family type VII secretion target n=1 Tax=Bacillus cereus group sp. BfR-BA-01492 TaxID=2920361 RepID=UPI001F597D41|nr:WXG100 family type VII secretion target [Bacillus cereus group sp. BfR-BA-01492]
MVQIKITPERLEQVAKTVKDARHQIDIIHKDLYNQIEYLSFQWAGASSQKFYQDFNEAKPKAFVILNEMDKVEEELMKAAEKFRNADGSYDGNLVEGKTSDDNIEEGAMCGPLSPNQILEKEWDDLKKDLGDAWNGIRSGVEDAATDTWEGLKALGDAETWENMRDAIVNYDETLPAAWNALSDSFMNEFWNGDLESREHYAAYAVASLGLGLFGDKGLSKAGQAGKVAAVASFAKGKSLMTNPAFRNSLNILNNFNFNFGNRLSIAGIGGGSLKSSFADAYQEASNKLSPYQYTKSTADGDVFVGKLYGKDVLLEDVKVEDITYTKRPKEEAEQLRKTFDSSVRQEFLKSLVNDPVKLAKLKKAGITDDNIELMKQGRPPVGWQVHHNLPLDDGGTNAFENLTLIQNHPYHKAITNTQRTLTRHLEPGDSADISWPIPKYNIYPKGE